MAIKKNENEDESKITETFERLRQEENSNYFKILNSVDCRDKIEQKNGLSYLSWAYAWAELKKRFPDATYTVYENERGWNYFTDDSTCWVKTGVTVNGIEHIEYLPVMDFRNKSIPLGSVTSFEVNKAIQRSLTKAIARHGLGLYIYAGEDLPDESDGKAEVKRPVQKAKAAEPKETESKETEPDVPARTELRKFLQEKKIDPQKVVGPCKLHKDSTPEEWARALAYAKKTFGE